MNLETKAIQQVIQALNAGSIPYQIGDPLRVAPGAKPGARMTWTSPSECQSLTSEAS